MLKLLDSKSLPVYQKLKYSYSINAMGVMNITPNSFSDGKDYFSYASFEEGFFLASKQFDIIDIGAESTAPFNHAISSKEELERFESLLFPLIANNPDPKITISIDTYRPEVFYEVLLFIKSYWRGCKVIFNDISGKVDDELLSLMKEKLDFEYVLCHNLCPSRDLSSNHMHYISSDVISSVVDFFNKNEFLNKLRVIHADPCFGFSKTFEQNHILLKKIKSASFFKAYKSLVLGLSKKSFLRIPKDLKLKENLEHIEQIHSCTLSSLLSIEHNLTIRSHSLIPIHSALVGRSLC